MLVQLAHLAGKNALVAGGGEVAHKKVIELLSAKMRIRVVAKQVIPDLLALRQKGVAIDLRPVMPKDLDGVVLCFAATDDRSQNRQIAEEARGRGIAVNVVDDASASTFFSAATVRRGDLEIGVGTMGASPLLAARTRRLLEALIPPGFSAISELFSRARELGLRGLGQKSAALSALSDQKLARLVDANDQPAIEARLLRLAAREKVPFSPGSVCLVGAGPGGRGLLTLLALERIHQADVVVHDALISEEILEEVLPGTRLIAAGRRCGQQGMAFADVQALLIAEARAGRRVLRLHAGDLGVFGRSGEEIAALTEACIPFELVPGVSAVVAAPAAAKVALTRRNFAQAVTIRSGHDADGYVARLPVPDRHETLVILMAHGAIQEILENLMREGYDPQTPAAAISRATLPDERVVRGRVADLAERVAAADLARPITFVLGQVLEGPNGRTEA